VSQAALSGGSGVRADVSDGALVARSLPRHGPANQNGWTPVDRPDAWIRSPQPDDRLDGDEGRRARPDWTPAWPPLPQPRTLKTALLTPPSCLATQSVLSVKQPPEDGVDFTEN